MVKSQRGVVTRAAAVDHLGASAVRWRLASGRWQRPWPGVVVTHSGPIEWEQRLWVAVLAAGRGAVVAGLTAAVRAGLRGFTCRSLHLLVPFGRQPRLGAGVVVRRSRLLGPEDVHPARLPPQTRLPRSLVNAASWMPTQDQAREVLAAGVQQRLVRVDDLRAVLRRLTTVYRRRLLWETLDDIAGGSHSLPELAFLRLLRRHGLPLPDRQVDRYDELGRRRWLDAYFERWRLVVEVDGMWHMEAGAWWADMLRDNTITIAGDRVLRFPSFVVREQPELVAGQFAAALRAAGWPDGRSGAVRCRDYSSESSQPHR